MSEHKKNSEKKKKQFYCKNLLSDKERIGWEEMFDHELLKSKLESNYGQGLIDKSSKDQHMKFVTHPNISSEIVNIDATRVQDLKLDDQAHSEEIKIAKEITE